MKWFSILVIAITLISVVSAQYGDQFPVNIRHKKLGNFYIYLINFIFFYFVLI